MIKRSHPSVFAITACLLCLLFHSGCTRSDYCIVLTWDVPTTNTDGTPLTDLAGYELSMGTSANNYTRTINIPAGDSLLSCKDGGYNKNSSINSARCSYTVSGLQQGEYYFAISAYNAAGKKSIYSNEVKKMATLSMHKK